MPRTCGFMNLLFQRSQFMFTSHSSWLMSFITSFVYTKLTNKHQEKETKKEAKTWNEKIAWESKLQQCCFIIVNPLVYLFSTSEVYGVWKTWTFERDTNFVVSYIYIVKALYIVELCKISTTIVIHIILIVANEKKKYFSKNVMRFFSSLNCNS